MFAKPTVKPGSGNCCLINLDSTSSLHACGAPICVAIPCVAALSALALTGTITPEDCV